VTIFFCVLKDFLPPPKVAARVLDEDDEDNAAVGEAYEEALVARLLIARSKISKVKFVFLLHSFDEALVCLSEKKFDRILTGPDHAGKSVTCGNL
jgi:hypothetical protein